MDQLTKDRMKQLSEWMRELYKSYVKVMVDETGQPPTEWQFARDVLGTSDYNYFRWRDLKNPISDINLLLLAVNTQDTTPLQIFEKTEILGSPDLVNLITSWRGMPEEDRERILEIMESASSRRSPFLVAEDKRSA